MDNNLQPQENNAGVRYSLDRNGVLLDIGEDIEKITGYKKEEIIGQNFRSFIYPDDEQGVCLHFQKAVEGIYEPCDFRIATRDGKQIMVRSVCNPPGPNEGEARVDGILTLV